jgi:mannose-6-phosphate isomerase-like protein (cupin superfamily)
MFIRDYNECEEFVAGDNCIIRELFNPLKDKQLDLHYSFAVATVKPGEITHNHKMKTSEVYYILSGKGLMYIDKEEKEVGPRQAIYIPPNAMQRIKNTSTEDLHFICIVDPAWRPEDEKVIE